MSVPDFHWSLYRPTFAAPSLIAHLVSYLDGPLLLFFCISRLPCLLVFLLTFRLDFFGLPGRRRWSLPFYHERALTAFFSLFSRVLFFFECSSVSSTEGFRVNPVADPDRGVCLIRFTDQLIYDFFLLSSSQARKARSDRCVRALFPPRVQVCKLSIARLAAQAIAIFGFFFQPWFEIHCRTQTAHVSFPFRFLLSK